MHILWGLNFSHYNKWWVLLLRNCYLLRLDKLSLLTIPALYKQTQIDFKYSSENILEFIEFIWNHFNIKCVIFVPFVPLWHSEFDNSNIINRGFHYQVIYHIPLSFVTLLPTQWQRSIWNMEGTLGFSNSKSTRLTERV